MTTDLDYKKKKYLALTFIFQLALGVDILVVFNLINLGYINMSLDVFVMFHVSLMLATTFLAWYTTCLFFKKNRHKIIYGISGIVALVLTTLASIPSWQQKPFVDILSVAGITIMLINIGIWFVIIIKDIFFNSHDLTYRIWGAANIYWMVAIIFAYMFFLFEMIFPGSFGIITPSNTDFLNHAFKLSLHSMVSIEDRKSVV